MECANVAFGATREVEVRRIIVGGDGSPSSIAAMAWAVEEAAARDAEIVAVAAWEYPFAAAAAGAGFSLGSLGEELPAAAARDLQATLDAVDVGSVVVHTVIEEGRPAAVLLRHAAEADLLVVGARGLGGFTGLLLGSVSQQCATHAPCPTVIVHPDARGSRSHRLGRREPVDVAIG